MGRWVLHTMKLNKQWAHLMAIFLPDALHLSSRDIIGLISSLNHHSVVIESRTFSIFYHPLIVIYEIICVF